MLFTVELYILRPGTIQLHNTQKEPNFHSFDTFYSYNNNILPCCVSFTFPDVLHTFKFQPIFCSYIKVGPYTLYIRLPYTEYAKNPTAGVPLKIDNFHDGVLSLTCSQYPTTCFKYIKVKVNHDMAMHALEMWWFSSNPSSTWHSKEAQGQTTLQPLYH
jgi:hypothetical protein